MSVSTYSTPAMQRSQARRDRRIEQLETAKAKIADLYESQDWNSSVDLMYAVVEETKISLATVNLAYQQFKKSRL